jgi:hypothetical protein
MVADVCHSYYRPATIPSKQVKMTGERKHANKPGCGTKSKDLIVKHWGRKAEYLLLYDAN